MRNRVFELKPGAGYTFLIGTREEAPTNRTRERLARALAGVWDDLFGGEEWVPPYGFELVPDYSPSEGENELPIFEPGKTYIVFVLLESANSAVSEERERQIADGILGAIRAGAGERRRQPKIGIVILWNGSVSVLENPGVRERQSPHKTPEEWARSHTGRVKGWGY